MRRRVLVLATSLCVASASVSVPRDIRCPSPPREDSHDGGRRWRWYKQAKRFVHHTGILIRSIRILIEV